MAQKRKDFGVNIAGQKAVLPDEFTTLSQTEDLIDIGVSSKQDTLVSGTNIKTVNNNSILGSGNMSVVPYFNVYSQSNLSINGNNGTYFICSISGNSSFMLSNIATGVSYIIRIKNTSSSAITITLPTTADIKPFNTFTIAANNVYRELSLIYDGTNRIWQVSVELV